MTTSLLQKLKEYNKTHIPMHMPGHKRNESLLGKDLPYDIDITEVDGFDNLHDMEGTLKETADFAARLYGARQSFPLVNGSSCGILAAMYALCKKGAHILMSRDSHKSVYNGVELLGLVPHYLTAETDVHGISGKIKIEDVESALLTHPEISLLILTSPTYEGVVQNVTEIAAICHQRGVHVLVDSAHGAHLGFSDAFPENAVKSGADIVVMSLHKTMPALTQTALLHLCTEVISEEAIREALAVFETTSPSYVLLASIDTCLRFVQTQKDTLFSKYQERLSVFYQKASALKHISVFHLDDPGKILISTRNITLTGASLAHRLRTEFFIETEMSCPRYVLAMTSICDTDDSLEILYDALHSIDSEMVHTIPSAGFEILSLPKQLHTSAEVKHIDGTFVLLSQSEGKIALESVWAYPPGIPLIVPGEEIPQGFAEVIQGMMDAGVDMKSTKGRIKKQEVFVALPKIHEKP